MKRKKKLETEYNKNKTEKREHNKYMNQMKEITHDVPVCLSAHRT